MIEQINYSSFHGAAKGRLLGIGFLVHKRFRNLVIYFKMISEFISILNIKAKFYKITLVNVHAPTEEKDDSTKNMFYKLEDIISNLPKYDVTVMLAALNVKIE